MKKNKNLFYLSFILSFFLSFEIIGQIKNQIKIPDSLKNISFEKFEKVANNMNISKEIRVQLANNFYNKAKKENDKLTRIKSMYWQARLDFDNKATPKIIDSLIYLSKGIDDIDYPAKAHILKAEFLMYSNKILEGLEKVIYAEKLAKEKGNIKQSQLVKKQIGLINEILGRFDLALKQFIEYKSYFESEKEKSREYLYAVLMISSIYNKLNKPDIAISYLDPELKKISRENFFYKFFIMYKGISLNLKREYKKSNLFFKEAIDLLEKSNNKNNLPISYMYFGKNIISDEHNDKKAMQYFVKVDSMLSKYNNYSLDTRENYLQLIEITKKQKNFNEQLYYLNRLIEIDSILKEKNKILFNKVNEKYDTPHLLEEKENVITNLNTQKYINLSIIGIFFISLISSGVYIRKLRNDKKKFLRLMEKNIIEETKSDSTIEERNEKILDMPEEIAEAILKKLEQFETNKEYLDNTINQAELAKKLNTNSNYLSRTVNYYKKKNYSKYINDLRVEYVIQKVKDDKKFRNYTIKAIASEAGFNNSESFAKAFYAKTGLQPSYFIKKIR